MIDTNKRKESTRTSDLGSQRSYNDVVEFLNANWSAERTDKKLTTIKQLDKALGYPSKATNAILVAGTNGKSLTINFATQLLKEEGLSVGALYAPHILTYNERFAVDGQSIANKQFTDIANEVISAAHINNIAADTQDMLVAIALLYFKEQKVDVAFLEVAANSVCDPVNICAPKVLAITRITDDQIDLQDLSVAAWIDRLTEMVQPGTWVASADQSKLNLQVVLKNVSERGGQWGMPIRKLAPLGYPFEQLHGRCAALAERICQLYIDNYVTNDSIIVSDSLLAKEKGRRGRPTLEAKRQAELNPKKTIDQYWRDVVSTLPGRFQILSKEKPTILLDNACNIDALKNLFLGIRLLHYQRPLKGITFILACDKDSMHTEEFLRALRYFAKKNTTNVVFCPLENQIAGVHENSWDVEQITNDVKTLKIKARSAKSFDDAFEMAKKSVDERQGLVVITGSKSIIAQFWHHKGIKKF
ncbi:MAG: hypothetical protein AB7F19_01525 [Candidatus Babeliales bacterium]